MHFKKIKKALTIILLTLFIIPLNVSAYSDYIIAGGQNIGIQLNSKGIMVVGLYKVDNSYIGKDAGLKIGDSIVSINDKDVTSIAQMVDAINNASDKTAIKVGYNRNGNQNSAILNLHKDEDGVYKTGLYVKDTINGIGTLTFIDPNTKLFGALGHEIIEKTTGQKIEIKDGKIFKSEVTGIEKSEDGNPGEKNARLFSNNVYGNVNENTTSGIFGKYSSSFSSEKLYKVANPSDISKGEAKILTVLDDNQVEEYNINILKINTNNNQHTKNILFEIVDEELLEKTGGIVQGMSGSPIIQNDYIIGAVTHVVVDDTTRGYGIFITTMLEEAEN